MYPPTGYGNKSLIPTGKSAEKERETEIYVFQRESERFVFSMDNVCHVWYFLNLMQESPVPQTFLLYVLYQNITIECWSACLYPFNEGDFLSDLCVSVTDPKHCQQTLKGTQLVKCEV